MIENLRVGGEGRYFDERGAAAIERASAIERGADAFLKLLARGNDVPPDSGSTATISEYLVDPSYEDEVALLFEACRLTVAGKREAGSNALLTFCNAVAERFGASTLPE